MDMVALTAMPINELLLILYLIIYIYDYTFYYKLLS